MTDNSTEEWFAALPASQRPILDRLRSLILATVPNAKEEIKWSRPCYSTNERLFCYLHTSKGHATLGFQNGASMSDPKNLLEGDGKDMRHIKLRSLNDLDEPTLCSMLAEAASP